MKYVPGISVLFDHYTEAWRQIKKARMEKLRKGNIKSTANKGHTVLQGSKRSVDQMLHDGYRGYGKTPRKSTFINRMKKEGVSLLV